MPCAPKTSSQPLSWTAWSPGPADLQENNSSHSFIYLSSFFFKKKTLEFGLSLGVLKNGLIKNIPAIPANQAPTRDEPVAPLGQKGIKSHAVN